MQLTALFGVLRRKESGMGDQRVPWKRVTAEFLAIFAGVSLSLVADDWRQARVDAAREETLLTYSFFIGTMA